MEAARKTASLSNAEVMSNLASFEADRSCHVTHDFEEIFRSSLNDDLRCIYCLDFSALYADQFKSHLLKVHFTYAFSYVLDGQPMSVLPCRKGCITRPKQGNRSHFHCPACSRTYGRKPAFAKHVEMWKGRCVPAPERASAKAMKRPNVFNTFPPMEKSFSLPTTSSGFGKPGLSSSYTVVVEKDDMASASRSKVNRSSSPVSRTLEPGVTWSSHHAGSFLNSSDPPDDAAAHFGKTVASRIRVLGKRKQAEAMQKVMQLLYDIEYSDEK